MMRRVTNKILVAFAVQVLLMMGASVAFAEGGSAPQSYGGVVPDSSDDTSAQDRSSQDPNVLTWIGFQADADKTRVFVQTRRPASYEINDAYDEGRIVIAMDDVRITRSNFRRFIDTSQFERNVDLIEVEEPGRNRVEIVLTLSGDERPAISETDGYLFLDFPHDGEARTPPVADAEDEGPTESADMDSSDESDSFAALEAPSEGDDEAATMPGPTEGHDSAAPGRRGWAIPLAVGGLAMMGGGMGLHLNAESRRETVTDVPPGGVVPVGQVEARDIERRANQLDTAALTLVIAGGVATALGVGAWLIRPSDDGSSTVSASPTSDGFAVDFTLHY